MRHACPPEVPPGPKKTAVRQVSLTIDKLPFPHLRKRCLRPTPSTATASRSVFARFGPLLCLLGSLLCAAAQPPESDRRAFDLPADAAEKTLKMFSEQSGCGLIMGADVVSGIRTNGVKGDFTPRAALARMLSGTGLVANEDEKSGAFVVKSADPNRPGSISGSVLRPSSGPPIDGFTVTVDETGRTGATDSRGRFRISGIPPGSYTLSVTSNAYHPLKIGPVIVQPNADTELAPQKIQLSPMNVETGFLRGRVSDAVTKAALPGARVCAVGTSLETYTDQQGRYELANVPAGPVTLGVSYVGYPALEVKGRVVVDQMTVLDAAFAEEVITMNQYVITGAAVGTARAVNAERAAAVLTNVIAADFMGQLPDKNIAEAAMRLPGVDLYRDKGEGRFIEIRGIDPIYIGVSINGVRASTPERGTREVSLDTISSVMVAGLEVAKVTTPDMDADAVGGSINIKTRSGFDQEGAQAMIAAGTNWSSQEDRHGGFDATAYFGNQYLDGKLGLFIGVTGEYRPFTDYNNQAVAAWSQVPFNGQQYWLYGGNDFRHYDMQRYRHGLDISLDYKLGMNSTAFVRYAMSYYTERDNYSFIEPIYSKYTSILGITNYTSATVVLPANAVIQQDNLVGNAKITTSLVGGINTTLGPWTNIAEAGYTIGKFTRPQVSLKFANTAAMTMTYDFTDPYHPVLGQTAGPSILDPGSYAFSTSSTFTNTAAGMHEKSVRDDFRRDFTVGALPAFVKAGGEYRNKNNYETSSSSSINSIPFTLADETVPDSQYRMGGFPQFRMLPQAMQNYFQQSAGWPLTFNASSSLLGSFQALENVASAYAMGGLTVGELKIIAGVRDESTHFRISGWQYDSTTGALTPVTYVKNFGNVLPDVVLTYEIDPKTLVRASWTNTIARPDYQYTIPGRTVSDSIHTVVAGNPSIPPLEAVNWDASIEHYFASLGVVSVAVYYKNVRNFPYSSGGTDTDPFTGYALSTSLAAPGGWVEGLEADWTQRFGFLPAPLDGLGAIINLTFNNSTVHYPTRPNENVPFVGLAKNYLTAALTYEKRGLQLKLAAQHHSPRIEVDTTLGANSTQDIYEDAYTQLDFGSSYTFAKHWQVYVNLANLTRAPFRTYYGGTPWKKVYFYEQYGMNGETGVRWTY